MNNHIFPFLWMRGESEEIMREEIGKINECGIGAICVEARPHDDFCGPGWWHDMDIVLDECKKRCMKVWILDDKHFPTGYAAGLIEKKYPERRKVYLADTSADVFGGQHTLTLNVDRMRKPTIGFWQIGAPANYAERANNTIYAVTATKFTDRKEFAEETIDLTAQVKDGQLTFRLPEGAWRVHVIYKTRTDGGDETYINMLDYTSCSTQIEGVYEAHYQRYPEEFGKTIAGFFSDEPCIGNTAGTDFYAKLGNDREALPWSDELESILKEKYGDKLNSLLPFLYVNSDTMDICQKLRYDYMDAVSSLYRKNFSMQLGDWCRAHGVEYIGHVIEDMGAHSRLGSGAGHYFRAMAGQDMAGVDVIGSQVIFGAPYEARYSMGDLEIDGDFYHYLLCRLGSSEGHLDPLKKGRTMIELFGAYGWSFGVRNMRYLLDHCLVRGINHLVPHAFSMAEYPDADCPPHFYARGNNGQFAWFKELMKYANRMCDLLCGGIHVPTAAVLYDGEADWTGKHMPAEKLTRVLTENQIDFDVVCLDMLNDLEKYNGKLENGVLTVNGVEFGALFVPYTEYAGPALMKFLKNCGNFPVYFVGGEPSYVIPETGDVTAFTDDVQTVSVKELPALLKEQGLQEVQLSEAASQVSVYRYRKDGREILMLMNEDPDHAYKGTVSFKASGALAVYEGFGDRYLDIETAGKDGTVSLILEAGESIVLTEKKDIRTTGVWTPFEKALEGCSAVDISADWKVSIAHAKTYPEVDETFEMKELVPVSDLRPKFSGLMRYEKDIEIEKAPEKAYFLAENVYEVMHLFVNGKQAGSRLTPPYQIEITDLLKEGTNHIELVIANTPARDQLNYPQPPFDFLHEVLEESGMYGKVQIYMK